MTSTPGSLFFILNRYNHSNPFLFIISKKSHHGPKFFERMFIKHLLHTRLNLLESSRLLSLWFLFALQLDQHAPGDNHLILSQRGSPSSPSLCSASWVGGCPDPSTAIFVWSLLVLWPLPLFQLSTIFPALSLWGWRLAE